MTPPQEQVMTGAKVVGGTGITGWLATNEPILAWFVGLLTAAVLTQTLYKNLKKK